MCREEGNGCAESVSLITNGHENYANKFNCPEAFHDFFFLNKIFSSHQPCQLVINCLRFRAMIAYTVGGAQMIRETSVILNQLTKLIAREYFINVSLVKLSLCFN